jgi:hypothetical protein
MMHISRKPGQQIEVSWAGDTTSVIDRDTCKISKVYAFDVICCSHEQPHLCLCRSLPGHESGYDINIEYTDPVKAISMRKNYNHLKLID